MMKYDFEFFEKFTENPEAYSDEEFLEIMPLFIEFMRRNREILGLADEQIENAVRRFEDFRQRYEDAGRAAAELELANKQVEQSLDRLEDALFDAMEKNGGKPVPMFLNLPARKKYDSN